MYVMSAAHTWFSPNNVIRLAKLAVSSRVVLRTRRASKTSNDDCRFGSGSPRFAHPLRKTAEIVPRGARAQIQVRGSGTVASRPHVFPLCRTWSSLQVRARVSTPPDIGTPCSTALVYPTWPCFLQAD